MFLASYDDEEFGLPIAVLEVIPANLRYSEALTHRDYLGALMNLGIERSCIGDILMKENGCCVFCQEKMADYLCQELTMVRHTSVICRRADATEPITPKMERVSGSVASPRLDSVIAMVFSSSRTKILPLIEGEKVFIDGKQVTSRRCSLKRARLYLCAAWENSALPGAVDCRKRDVCMFMRINMCKKKGLKTNDSSKE